MHLLTGVADARPSWSAGQRPAEEPWHRRDSRVRWRGRALAPGVGPRPVPRRALAHALGAGPCPVRCRALALGAGSHPVPRRAHAQGAGPQPPLPLAPNHHRSGAASMASLGHAGCGPAFAGPSVPLTTAPWPARVSRLLQVVLPRVPAAPVALTYPQSHSTTHQVHPAILAPTRPPPATAGTGFLRQRHSRAPPPPARRQPILVGYGLPAPQGMWIPAHAGTTRRTPPLHMVERGPGGEATPLTCRPCRR